MTRVVAWILAPLLFAVGVAWLLAYVEGRRVTLRYVVAALALVVLYAAAYGRAGCAL